MSRMLLSFALIAALIGFSVGSADAAAIGTSSQDTIWNGVFNSGDTQPQAAGELSISCKKSATNGDSTYKGISAVQNVVVDTGYDLGALNSPSDKTGGIGDTVSYGYGITNLSNATITVYIDSIFHPLNQSDSGPGSPLSTNWDIAGSYKFYYDLGNDYLWATGDTQITSIVLPSGASDTINAVVIIPTDANNGETTTTWVSISDRAPRKLSGTTTGDGWQDSTVKANDTRDTQTDTTVTTVAGPNLFVSKTIAELTGTNSRPGDTLVINISFDNDGSDSARGVEIMDAVPSNTWLIANSADSVALPNAWSFNGVLGFSDTAYRVYYDTDAVGSAYRFDDTYIPKGSDTSAKRLPVSVVKWTLAPLVGYATNGVAGTVDFDQTYNDNGRVEFRVYIQ